MITSLRLAVPLAGRSINLTKQMSSRAFSLSRRRTTDGVFRDLTDVRLAIPWSTALERREKGQVDQSHSISQAERDLSLKKMSDSYFSTVGDEIPFTSILSKY